MAELTPGADPSPIRIPEWDDILHVTPRTNPTPGQRRAWNGYLNRMGMRDTPVATVKERIAEHRASGDFPGEIGDAELETLLRGRQIYQQMRGSEIPQWRQSMISTLTALDNIEDQLSTIEWVTRPLTSKWAPTKVLSKVVRRTNEAIDGIEQVLAGPSIAKALQKDRATRRRRRAGDRARGKVGKFGKAVQWVGDNFGHLLEASQATDTWFGVGISLGSVFGAIEETQDRLIISAYEGAKATVAGAARAFTTEDSDFDLSLQDIQRSSINRVRETGGEVVEQYLAAIPQPLIYTNPLLFATQVFRAAMDTAGTKNPPTKGEHALALYHLVTIGALLAPILEHVTDQRAIARIPELDVPGPRVVNDYTRELLLEAGATLTPHGKPTGIWQAPTRSVRTAVDQDAARILDALHTWLPSSDAADEDALLLELVDAGAEISGHLLTGRPDGLRLIPHAEARAEVLMHHLERYPPPGTSRAQLQAWIDDQVKAIELDPDGYDSRTWTRITDRHWPSARGEKL